MKYLKKVKAIPQQNLVDGPEFKQYYLKPLLVNDTSTTEFDTHYVYHMA